MKRKDFLELSIPAFLLLANGRILKAHEFVLSEEHRKKVKLRFVVASDGHYGQRNTEYENFYSTVVSRINEEHRKHPFSFCVINGDVVHDDKTHYPAAKKVLDALHPKYYVSQGNHDRVTFPLHAHRARVINKPRCLEEWRQDGPQSFAQARHLPRAGVLTVGLSDIPIEHG